MTSVWEERRARCGKKRGRENRGSKEICKKWKEKEEKRKRGKLKEGGGGEKREEKINTSFQTKY